MKCISNCLNWKSHQYRQFWCSVSDLFDNDLMHEGFLISSLHLNGHINHFNNCNNIEDVIWELHDNISLSLCVLHNTNFLLTILIYYQKRQRGKKKLNSIQVSIIIFLVLTFSFLCIQEWYGSQFTICHFGYKRRKIATFIYDYHNYHCLYIITWYHERLFISW